MITPSTLTTTSDVGAHYDELDPYYRKLWGEHLHHGLWTSGRETRSQAVTALIEKVVALLDITGNSGPLRLCDIGSGYGATSRYLATHYQALCTGLTVSEKQWLHAKNLQAGNPNPEFLLCDWLSNPLPDEHFDGAFSIESSEHMPDKNLFFRQALRVLKPGAKLVICAWLSKENPSRREIKYLLEPICREGRLPGLCTESEMKNLYQENGFEFLSSQDLTRQVERSWWMGAGEIAKNLLLDSKSREYLLSSKNKNREFVKTVLRIAAAYKTGTMRYGIFCGRKPAKLPL